MWYYEVVFLSLHSKRLTPLSINLVGKFAFLNLFLIILFPFVKSELIYFDLFESPMITLLVYFLGILDFQGVGDLVSLQWTNVIKISF